MPATCGVGIECIHLADVGSDGMEYRRTCDHSGGRTPFPPIHPIGNTSEKAWIVICGGSEYVSLFIETNSPSVVIELMKEFHLRSIGFETEGTRSEIELFSADLALDSGVSDGSVNPIIQSVSEVAWTRMRIPRSESRKKDFPEVRHIVPIGIL